MTDETELEDVADELERLKRVVIDTSSLIYCHASGVLDILARTIALVTVPQVLEEYGEDALPCEVVDLGSGPTDRLVVDCGRQLGVPVVSDDRKLLLSADSVGVRYYNAFIMLVLLLTRSEIAADQFAVMRGRLLETAHYSRRIQEYGDDLAHYVMTQR